MRFLVDECAGPRLAQWLRGAGFDVFSVYDEARGSSDSDLLTKAFAEDWILVTADKDFGEKVFREGMPHRGVILLRLRDQRSTAKIETLRLLLEDYAAQLPNAFVVVSEKQIRVTRSST